MRIAIGQRSLASLGGTETYTLTVAEALERLGHKTAIVATERGEVADIARDRGLAVVGEPDALDACDATLANDLESAYALAARFPNAARVAVQHTTLMLGHLAPHVPDVVGAVVALNDRVRRHVEAGPGEVEVVRLHQPVDLNRFLPVGISRPKPRVAAVFGNRLQGWRYQLVADTLAEAGLEVRRIGMHGTATSTPELEIGEADIVIGIGRCAIEALCAGRATYVCDAMGMDGWVTPESFPALEADGFTGRATGRSFDPAVFREDLAAWTPALGEAARDLGIRHHDANIHAQQLVALWQRLGADNPPPSASDDLARMGRLIAQLESRTWELARRGHDVLMRMENELHQAGLERRHLEERVAGAEREAQRLAQERAEFMRTRRYRAAVALGSLADRLRRRR